MNEQDELYELIQQYLDGKIKGEALNNVENRLKNDSDFASEVALHRALFKIVEPETPQVIQLKNSLKKIRQEAIEHPSPSKSNQKRNTTKIYWAIALLLAIGLLYFFIIKPSKDKSPIPNNVEAPPIAMVTPENSLTTEALFSSMKGDNSNTFSDALDLFKKGAFNSSLNTLNQIPSNKIDYDSQLLIGLNHLRLKQYEEAVKKFDNFSQFDKRKVLDKSKWCLAITYLKMDRPKDYTTTLQLIKKEGYYYPKEMDIDSLINSLQE